MSRKYGARGAACPASTGRGTRRVPLVRGEGRGVSRKYGARDAACPASTGAHRGVKPLLDVQARSAARRRHVAHPGLGEGRGGVSWGRGRDRRDGRGGRGFGFGLK